MAFNGMTCRVESLLAWVERRDGRRGEPRIPPDPNGPVGVARFRRTLAWQTARQPGGLAALATQYDHLNTLISEGCAGRSRGGPHDLIDLEHARAMAHHFFDTAADLADGGRISGPTTNRLAHAAAESSERFGGAILNKRQASALLSDPGLRVCANAEAYLWCHFDPAKALCVDAQNPGHPRLDRCRPNCGGIARTDTQIVNIRSTATNLRAQATATVSLSIASRLTQHANDLELLAGAHREVSPAAIERPKPVTAHAQERLQIREAMDRPLAGQPIRSSGALTVLALAQEAGLQRHVLTHRHLDLKDDFYAADAKRSRTSDAGAALLEHLAKARAQVVAKAARIRELEADAQMFARVVNVFTLELGNLRSQTETESSMHERQASTREPRGPRHVSGPMDSEQGTVPARNGRPIEVLRGL